MVMTVTGEVDPGELGFIQPCEHIFLDGYAESLIIDLILDDVEVARDELQRFVVAGGKTIVESTPHGLHPTPALLPDLASELGIHIVVGTGIYWERFHPAWVKDMSTCELTEFFMTELTNGVDGTSVRAGMIGEIGSGHREISPAEERVFRAAAAAHCETGVPIYTHAPFGRVGLQQVTLLESEGVNLEQVVIGHVDTVSSFDYKKQVAETGVYLGFDTIGRADCGADEKRIDIILTLIELGYGDRILLSSDVCRQSHLHQSGGFGYDYILCRFIPRLSERGVSDEMIHKMTHENPARLWKP